MNKTILEDHEFELSSGGYAVVNLLKKKGTVDTYDYQTNFNPFLVSD